MNKMVFYCTWQLERGALKYATVINKFPDLKDGIDLMLLADGYEIVNDRAVKITSTDTEKVVKE